MAKTCYVNKAGKMYKGEKPKDMSDDEYRQMMEKKGYSLKKMGHESTAPSPKKDRSEPANRGTPNADMRKSENDEEEAEVEVSTLEKALNELNQLATQRDPQAKREGLLEKAMNGDISEEDNAELRSILAGEAGVESTESLTKSVSSQLDPQENETFGKSVDVSEYLGEIHGATQGVMELLADTIEKSDVRNHEFQLLLAKSVVQIGHQVDHLAKSLDTWGEAVPATGRAAKTPKEALIQKSFGGSAPQEDRISKGEVLNLLEAMHLSSIEKGNGGMAHCGEDLQQSIAKYEQSMAISRPLLGELQSFRASRG